MSRRLMVWRRCTAYAASVTWRYFTSLAVSPDILGTHTVRWDVRLQNRLWAAPGAGDLKQRERVDLELIKLETLVRLESDRVPQSPDSSNSSVLLQ